MKVICPYCNKEVTGEDSPTIVKRYGGSSYICHKKICHNRGDHPDKNDIAVVFKPGEKE